MTSHNIGSTPSWSQSQMAFLLHWRSRREANVPGRDQSNWKTSHRQTFIPAQRQTTSLAITDQHGGIHPRTSSIPSRFSPLSSKRKSQPSKHTSPTSQSCLTTLPMVVTEEYQHMRLSSYFYRVTDNLSVDPPCGKLELFCLQKVVDNVVYCDCRILMSATQ